MSRFVMLCVGLLVASVVAAPAGAAAPPAVVRIALEKGDMPPRTALFTQFTHFYSPARLTGDTVPNGLSVKGLRAAGFHGLYTEAFLLPADSDLYSWQYLALGSPSAAHRVFLTWAKS